jgi:hypothetical protein
MLRQLALIICWIAPLWAQAQAIVTSSEPQATSVTIYRDPYRSGGGALNLYDLRGFALITETRRIKLPQGEATLRFEGVADGIMAKSAIILGLPGGVVEKNRDARLLSPAALMDAHIGKQVTLVRTDKATGKVQERRMVLRSGPDGIVLEDKDGVEALKCSGLPEKIIFDTVPEGLSAKPTLSVLTRSERAVEAVVTLAYLARGFDWSAQYVANINPDGKTLHLTSWVTLANANSSSFVDSSTQLVAGTLNRKQDDDAEVYTAGGYSMRCWPWDSTSTYPSWKLIPPMPQSYDMESMSDIIVTAQRVERNALSAPIAVSAISRKVSEEQLGDLKLYRVPFATTVAANAQKQVLMLDQSSVPFERIYQARLFAAGEQTSAPMKALLRTKNDKKNDLGLALPSGKVAVFENVSRRPMLAGEDGMRDTAVNEEVEIVVGDAPGVRIESVKDKDSLYSLTLSNDQPYAINAEVELDVEDGRYLFNASLRHMMKNGRPIWRVSVPANGNHVLRYQLRQKR